MKILLLGEYSNVHHTLSLGLKLLGHQVTLISNGDFWKDYPRDIDVARKPGLSGGIHLLMKVYSLLPKMRGYDIVQFINPMFLELKAERLFPIYRYLRKYNRKVVLGAFGMDYYWVNINSTAMPLRYSDFNIGTELRQNKEAINERKDWTGTTKEQLNRLMAEECDGIVAGLYEYWMCYNTVFPQKTKFIPFPIKTEPAPAIPSLAPTRLHLFIGISRNRSAYKGTDIMLRAAQAVKEQHPDRMDLKVATGLPFVEYVQAMKGADAIMDQLYSYTPSMNPLEAMSRGIICIGGGEPENYEILGENKLKPIINVMPSYDDCVQVLERLVTHLDLIPKLKKQSIAYVQKHHDYIKVAREYEAFYNCIISK